MTQAEFSRLRGVNPVTVSRWARLGYIVFEGKLVHVAKSIDRLEGRFGETRAREANEIAAATIPPKLTAKTPFTQVEASRVKENFVALSKELDYDKASGAVVDADLAAAGIAAVLLVVKNKLLGLPSRLAPALLNVTDPEIARAALAEGVSEALEELSASAVTADAIRSGIESLLRPAGDEGSGESEAAA